MRKYFAALLLLTLPLTASAAPVSWDFNSNILQPLQSGWNALVKASHFQATSTTASIFPYASTTAVSATSLYTTNLKVGTLSGLLKAASGVVTAAVSNTDYQAPISLTTGGSSGPATFNGSTLNIPEYSSGGGSSFSYPFPGNATSTQITFNGGLVGALTGNADTATALAANGTNCSSGSYARGVDASGNAENCTADADTTYTATYPVTLTGTALGIAFGTTTSNTWAGTQTFTNLITGSISGNAGTASALAANGSNASAGFAILGIDASGNAEGAFDVWTEAENTAAAYINATQDIKFSTTSANYWASLGLGFSTTSADYWGSSKGYLTSAVTAIGAAGQTSDGPTVTFATSSDTNIGLTITGSGDTQTFTSNWIGTLADARVSDTLTIGSGSTVADGALSANVSLLGSSIDISSETNLAATWPAVLTNDTLSIGFSTSSALAANQVLYATAVNTFGSEAAFGYDASANRLSFDYASSTAISLTNLFATNVYAPGSLSFFSNGITSTNQMTWNGTALLSVSMSGQSIGLSNQPWLAGFFTNASTTNLTASTFFQLPNSSSQSPLLAGACAWDTTSGQLKCGDGAATQVIGDGKFYPSFTYATSTAWAGTTTIPLGPAYVAETWNGVKCFTDAGTVQVSFYDGTNRMNWLNASTTVGLVTLNSNNTFTASEKRYVDVGTPASSPTKISCTISKSYTAD